MVLCLICFFLLIVRLVYPSFIEKDPEIRVENLPVFERADSSGNTSATGKDKFKTPKRFVFDPNTVSEKQLIELGLKAKTASTFIKFRSKGFEFRQKEDLKKVYGISGNLYKELEPYVLIEKKKGEPEGAKTQETVLQDKIAPQKKAKVIIELNSADSAMLVDLPGIGPGFARKIIKYRNLLGGYNSVGQLKEVYGFTDEMLAKLKGLVMIKYPVELKKINLNTDDFKTVNRHPYIEYETTRNIFNLKRSKKLEPSDIQKILNNDELYMKLEPYLEY